MRKILFQDDNPFFRNRIDYVLNFIAQHPLVKGKLQFIRDAEKEHHLKLYYGIEQADALYIPAQKLIFSNVLPRFKELKLNQYAEESMHLYAIERKQQPEQLFFHEGKFYCDLIETIFFHISRLEEYHCVAQDLDEHGRMKSGAQLLVHNQLHDQPLVDHMVFTLAKCLGVKINHQPTLFRMTHDIDVIRKNNKWTGKFRSAAAAILKMQDAERAIRVFKNDSDNPFDTFDWLLLEDTSIEKVIYFLVDGDSKYDTPYDLDDPLVKKIIKLAKGRGYEIGIHPSYNTWKDQRLMEQETQKLTRVIDQPIRSTRQHFLRFDFPKTMDIIEDMEFKIDESLGFTDIIGFRCGTGFPYHLYNFKKEAAYRFLEIPLVFMESALLRECGFNEDKLKNIWFSFLQKNANNTMITFNFHNSRFYDAALSGINLEEFYRQQFI